MVSSGIRFWCDLYRKYKYSAVVALDPETVSNLFKLADTLIESLICKFLAIKGTSSGRAISQHGMIARDDKVLVALSGGKDSWALLHCLETLRRRAPIPFSLELEKHILPGKDDVAAAVRKVMSDGD